MTPELILEVLLAVLLIGALAAMWRLETRLRALRGGQAALQQTVVELNAAAHRADAAIKGLRVTADSCGEDLDLRIKRARALADELGMLVERGARIEPQRVQRPAEPAPVSRIFAGAR